jgi:hypothetical protein
VLDFNRACLSAKPISTAINELIARSERPQENTRQYLGASAIGSECLRRIQYDWMCDPSHPLRTRDIFRRGHLFEEVSRQHFIRTGFKFAPDERLRFTAVDGLFRGHADGILIDGPELPDIGYPAIWEHKCLGAKGWRALERDGLEKAYPHYAAQVWIYQAYLDVTEHPAIFTAMNADRAVTIIQATQAGELLPRFTDDQEHWRCKMCSHRERCWKSS